MSSEHNGSRGMRPANPDDPVSTLLEADQAARALSDTQRVGSAILSCPSQPADDRKNIEVKVVGEDGVGLDGIGVRLTRDGGEALAGKTGPAGVYKFTGLVPGSYELGLPALDQDAWRVTSTRPMPEAEAASTAVAGWRSLPAPAAAAERTHVVKQGDFVSKIAERYGFFSGTIWDYSANAELKKLRDDKMNILYAGDVVVVPAKRGKTVSVDTGNRVTVQRLGVPEYLRIRFLDINEKPRVGVPYLLSLVTENGDPVVDISSETDQDGNLEQPIPPSATIARVTLSPTIWPDAYEFRIGYKDPADTVSGWQARLNNLGYDCGAEDGIAGPLTRNAVYAFQRAKRIRLSGDMDAATLAALEAAALS